MKESIIQVVGNKLDNLNVFIDDVYVDKEDNNDVMHIVLDADHIISLNTVVMATRILSPLLDKLDIMKDSYILDVYAKEKGDVKSE